MADPLPSTLTLVRPAAICGPRLARIELRVCYERGLVILRDRDKNEMVAGPESSIRMLMRAGSLVP